MSTKFWYRTSMHYFSPTLSWSRDVEARYQTATCLHVTRSPVARLSRPDMPRVSLSVCGWLHSWHNYWAFCFSLLRYFCQSLGEIFGYFSGNWMWFRWGLKWSQGLCRSHEIVVNRFETSQEIPSVLWNPEVNYRICKCRKTVSTLGHLEPVHNPKCHSLKIYFHKNPHLNLGLHNGLFPSGFNTKTCTRLSLPPYALHAPPIT